MASYNLLYCTDNNYLPYTFVACQSVINSLERSPEADDDTIIFNIFIDDSVDPSAAQSKCNQFIKRNANAPTHIKFNLKLVDSSSFEGATKFRGTNVSTYYRIILDQLLPEYVSTVLYLDVDTFVRKDIRCLFNDTNLSGVVCGAVRDLGIELTYQKSDFFILKPKSSSSPELEVLIPDYFNCGVLLINLVEFRKRKISEKCISIIYDYHLPFADQELLNYFVEKKYFSIYLGTS